MKPRLRKVEGFWHCVTPDAQGIGITPELAHREYLDLMFDMIQIRIEESRQESQRKEIEYQMEMMKLNMRALMAAYGFETDNAGNVVRDHWVEAMKAAPPKPPENAPQLNRIIPTEVCLARWWEFWK